MARIILVLAALALAAVLWFAFTLGAGGAGDAGELPSADSGPRGDAASESAATTGLDELEVEAASSSDDERKPAALPSVSNTNPVEAAKVGAIHVLLLDEDSVPIPGAEVRVNWTGGAEDDRIDRGHTDAKGLFKTGADEARQVKLIVFTEPDAPHHFRKTGPFECAPDRQGEIVLQLPRQGRVTGRVVDTSGAGVSDTRVVLTAAESLPVNPYVHMARAPGPARGSTDSDGRFVLGVFEGNHRFEVKSSHYRALHDVRVRTTHAEPNAEVVLYVSRCDRNVEVLVHAPAEPPTLHPNLPSVRAESNHAPAHFATDFGPRVTSSVIQRSCSGLFDRAEGKFDLPCLDPFPWTLYVTRSGCEPAEVPIPPNVSQVVVTLLPRAPQEGWQNLHVVVRSLPGAPQRAVLALLPAPDLTRLRETDTNELGEAEFRFRTGVMAGRTVYVMARSPGHAWGAAGPMPFEQHDPVVITVQPERRLTGKIVDADGVEVGGRVELFQPRSVLGTPAGGAADETEFLPEMLEGDQALAEPGAGFQFDGLGVGPYELWAYPDDASLPPGRAIAFGGEQATIVLGGGLEALVAIRGRTVDGLSGQPIPDARVSVDREDALKNHGGNEASSGQDGTFVLVGHAPGQLRLRIDRQGYATRRLPIQEFEGGEHELELAAFPARTLHVQAVNSLGAPLPGVRISASDADGALLLQDENGHVAGREAIADESGRADLRGLPAREVILSVHPGGDLQNTAVRFEFDLRAEILELVQLEAE